MEKKVNKLELILIGNEKQRNTISKKYEIIQVYYVGKKKKSSPKNWDANYYLGICKTEEWSV